MKGCFLARSCLVKENPMPGVESNPSSWMVSSGRMRMPSCCATSQIAFQRTVESELSEPIQEDYGWGLWASRGKDRFWVALSYVGDGPQEAPAQWVVSVTYDPGLNLAKRLFHKPDQQAL